MKRFSAWAVSGQNASSSVWVCRQWFVPLWLRIPIVGRADSRTTTRRYYQRSSVKTQGNRNGQYNPCWSVHSNGGIAQQIDTALQPDHGFSCMKAHVKRPRLTRKNFLSFVSKLWLAPMPRSLFSSQIIHLSNFLGSHTIQSTTIPLFQEVTAYTLVNLLLHIAEFIGSLPSLSTKPSTPRPRRSVWNSRSRWGLIGRAWIWGRVSGCDRRV